MALVAQPYITMFVYRRLESGLPKSYPKGIHSIDTNVWPLKVNMEEKNLFFSHIYIYIYFNGNMKENQIQNRILILLRP